MPVTQVPDEFYPILDTKVGYPEYLGVLRRRKRSTEVVTTNASLPKAPEFYTASGRRLKRRRRDLSLESESGSVMVVHILLQFDGCKVNLSEVDPLGDNATFLLHKPPTVFLPSDVILFYPNYDIKVELEVRGKVFFQQLRLQF
jgi:hypothetical protein